MTDELNRAIHKANDMVIGASLTLMDPASSDSVQRQSRYFMGLFSAVRDVLHDGSREASPAIERLVEAINSSGEKS